MAHRILNLQGANPVTYVKPVDALTTPELLTALEASRSLHHYLEAADYPQYGREAGIRDENDRWMRQLNVELRIRQVDAARRERCETAFKRAA